ncbi:MAG: FISUMP domain-containing protein [Bacteroidales bacterium]
MKKLFFFFSLLLLSISLFSQEEVKLKNGKTIIINTDGTWKYKQENPANNSFTDPRDGHVYKIVTIGTQTWMAENLAYKADFGCWAFDNNQSNVKTYGYLYNWETAKKVCPVGWHLPGEAEWIQLIDYLGGKVTAGDKIKSTNGWENGADANGWINGNGSNSSGFSALPGGDYKTIWIGGMAFGNIGSNGNWWTATEHDTKNAWHHELCSNFKSLDCFDSYTSGPVGYQDKTYGYSIRCIKDE